MTEFIFLSIGIIIGCLACYLFFNNKHKEVQTTLMLTAQRLEHEEKANASLAQQIEPLKAENDSINEALTHARIELGKLYTQLDAEREQWSKESELLKEQRAKEDELRREHFEQQLKTIQEQFQNLASKLLVQTSENLRTQNSEAMKLLTDPLKQDIEQLHQAIRLTNNETAKNTASLSQQLREMSEQTSRINTTATRLTNVIRGGNKEQGNWGERMLTEILDMQGLRRGVDYDIQQTITDANGHAIANDENGSRMIPDVVLHYPGDEDVIIDAKMSIEAYYQFVNTDDELLKQKYADDLVKSIRAQYTRLSRKDYSRYIQPPRHSIDFVIMFVPNEGALQLALAKEPRLWGDAFDRQVFITSQQNLMAILKMIQIAWRQYAQTENQKRVFSMAEEMLKRVAEFIKRFDKVGKDIELLQRDYNEAYNKASSGKQSIAQKANELKELGLHPSNI